MQIVKAQALVLHSLKFKETDLIVKLYVKDYGVCSYLVKGVLKTKRGKFRASMFMLGSFLEIDATHKKKSELHYLKEVRIASFYNSLHTNVIKSMVLTFTSELTGHLLPSQQPDASYFSFLIESYKWLDTHDKISAFLLFFLIQQTRFLGCYPSTLELENMPFLEAIQDLCVPDHLEYWQQLLKADYTTLECIYIPKAHRSAMIEQVLKYYQKQIPDFKIPKSLKVMQGVF